MYTDRSIDANLPENKVVSFHSSVHKITVNIPVRILEYYTNESSCLMVIQPTVGIDRDTLRSVIVDSGKMMDPFGLGERYSDIVSITETSENMILELNKK